MRVVAAAAAVAAVSAAPYNVVTWGDYGTGSSLQKENAVAINNFCAQTVGGSPACQRLWLLADNFYDGPFTTSDPRWQTELFDVYNATVPFDACLGNHDYKGSIQAQLNFTGDSRWNMPATNYSVTIPEADLTIVFLDTPRGCTSYMAAPYGDCNEQCMIQLAAQGCTVDTAIECIDAHAAWLNDTLSRATTTWKIVAGHHPLDEENLPHIIPSLAAHGVQAYLAGHVHNLQHNLGKDKVNYFVSGAGAFSSAFDGPLGGKTHAPRPLTCPEGSACSPLVQYFSATGPGFLSLSFDNEAQPPTATASFYIHTGAQVYNTTFTAA